MAAEKVKGLFPPVVELELTEDDLITEDDLVPEEEFDAQAEFDALGLGLGGLPPGMLESMADGKQGAIPPKTSDMVGIRESAYRNCFGPPAMVNHQKGSGTPHIDVYVHPPNKQRPFTTLVTGGMSDHPMRIPPSGRISPRCELMFYVDEPEQLYIELLRFLATMPYAQQTWFSYGSTVNNGNPPEPIFAGSVLDNYLFLVPFVEDDVELQETVSIKGSPLQLLLVTPITSAERKFIMKEGMEGFYPLMEKNKHPTTLAPGRKCYAKRGWFG